MHPLLQAVLDSFKGGTCLYMQDDRLYRGEIAALDVTEPDENIFYLKVTLAWNSVEISPPAILRFIDEGIPQGTKDWTEVTTLEHVCPISAPSPEQPAAAAPITVNKGRLFIQNPSTKEPTVLQPPADWRQPFYRITWLPDGPKAKLDAARAAADSTTREA